MKRNELRALLCVRRGTRVEEEEIRGFDGHTPPSVFFVRVANKGVRCDESRKSGKCRT